MLKNIIRFKYIQSCDNKNKVSKKLKMISKQLKKS